MIRAAYFRQCQKRYLPYFPATARRSSSNFHRAEALRTLSLGIDATKDDIQSAWRKAAMEMHPDRPSGNPEKFRRARDAYEVLMGARGDASGDEEPYRHEPSTLVGMLTSCSTKGDFARARYLWESTLTRGEPVGDEAMRVMLNFACRAHGNDVAPAFALVLQALRDKQLGKADANFGMQEVLRLCKDHNASMDFIMDDVLPALDDFEIDRDEDLLERLNGIFFYFSNI